MQFTKFNLKSYSSMYINTYSFMLDLFFILNVKCKYYMFSGDDDDNNNNNNNNYIYIYIYIYNLCIHLYI